MKRMPLTATLLSILIIVFCATAFADGEMTAKPFGFVLFNTQLNSRVKVDIPTVAAAADTVNVSNMLMTARQTRFGLALGYENLGWKMAGHIELDFWGLLGSGKNGASMQSAPRLRRAYFKMTKAKVSLLFGQEWVVFAPLSPTSDAHVSIPALSSSGNLWNRMPQIRLEVKAPMQANEFLLQLALLRPLAADNVTIGQVDSVGAGELNALPFVQGRAAMSFGKTATVGVSGHFGQENFNKLDAKFTKDKKTTTFAAALDVTAGNDNVKFMAEAFTGKNLGMLFSNASYRKALFNVKVVDTTRSDSTYKNEPLKVKGGWLALNLAPKNSKVSFNVGAGMETLNNDDVEVLAQTKVSGKTKPALSRNMTLFGNILFTPIPKVTFGLEGGYIKTTYKRAVADKLEEFDSKNMSLNFSSKISF